MTHPSDIMLLRYADGEQSKETVEHLAACAACRSVVQDARQISAALRALPVPVPPPSLPRTRGQTRPAPRWHAIAATLVAGILIGGTATYVGESDVAFAGLLPTTDRLALPTAPHPMGPGRWSYLTRDYEDSVVWALPYLQTVTVDSSATEWIIVTTSPNGERDSLRVDRRDLSPTSTAWHTPNGRAHATRRFTRDSMIDSVWGYSRSRRRAYPIGDSTHVRIASTIELRLFLRTQGLDRHWRQTVRFLGDSAQPAELAVSGRRTIDTPVGRCDCWRVVMAMRGHQSVVWVRADDGIVVKTENSYGVTELVAEDPLPN